MTEFLVRVSKYCFIHSLYFLEKCYARLFFFIGVNRFIKDIELMIGLKMFIWWKICWMGISPIALVVRKIYSLHHRSDDVNALYSVSF
jgi:hypothetical protein